MKRRWTRGLESAGSPGY